MKSLFDAPTIRSVEKDKELLKKAKKKSPAPKKGGGISAVISTIDAQVEQYLGKYKDDYHCVMQENYTELKDVVDACIENGKCAIDTETTGLNPLVDKIVGFSLYTKGVHSIYVPIRHVSYVTGLPSKGQIEIPYAVEQLKRLVDAQVKNIMANCTFDIRMLKNDLGVLMACWWDVILASRCMNENEPSAALKPLYKKYILKGKEDVFKFDELFHTVGFGNVPIKTGYLYGAHDSKITWDVQEYQEQFLYYDPTCVPEARNGMNGVSWVFHNIEMPCTAATAELEDAGVELDMDYIDKVLKPIYQKKLNDCKKAVYKIINMYKDDIAAYNGPVRLDNPINLDSPKQLSCLLYDIIGEPVVDKKNPHGTGEDILNKIGSPLTDAILEYRGVGKLMSTYIDKMPGCVHKADGRVHCHFHQYGADTGRFSSSDPNLQNIPSHNKDIRKMFKATDGYVMMSADFSQQEIKGMAQMCKDEGMIEAFKQGKDFYAEIASVAFGFPYEECLEFRPDGTTNKAGKERRGQAKSILLGINYGRGAQSIAEQLGCTKKKAEKIKEDVFEAFPTIKKFEEDSIEMAETLGYVTTLWGRKRRLPILMKDDFEFKWMEGHGFSDDPLDFDSDEGAEDEVPDDIIDYYTNLLNKTLPWKRKPIFEKANKEGIWIVDNTKDKIDATRQVVNSRIQGTAADQTKLAMIALHKNERLKELGFRMLIQVHDEIIAECPRENAEEVAELFADIMSNSGGAAFTIPITCDVEITDRWYGTKYKFVDHQLVEKGEDE